MTKNSNPMRLLDVCGLAFILSLAAPLAAAEEYVVSQDGKTFSERTLEAKVGDTVVFLNDDQFAHNIYSETPGYTFDFRKQMPGDQDILTLDKPGAFEIRCAIHPRMRMTIMVE